MEKNCVMENNHGLTKTMQQVSFVLQIETTDPVEMDRLMNRFESSKSKITKISASGIDIDGKEATAEQLNEKGFIGSSITLNGILSGTFTNSKGYWTISEMVQNIVNFERLNRPKTEWFGGIDTHHVFFENLIGEGNDYSIYWGS